MIKHRLASQIIDINEVVSYSVLVKKTLVTCNNQNYIILLESLNSQFFFHRKCHFPTKNFVADGKLFCCEFVVLFCQLLNLFPVKFHNNKFHGEHFNPIRIVIQMRGFNQTKMFCKNFKLKFFISHSFSETFSHL